MRSKYEIRAQKELERDGWVVDNKAGMAFYAKNRDFFHLFDLVAVKRGEKIRYIAIKGQSGGYKDLAPKIQAFWMPDCCIKELWRWPKKTDRKKEAWLKTIL